MESVELHETWFSRSILLSVNDIGFKRFKHTQHHSDVYNVLHVVSMLPGASKNIVLPGLRSWGGETHCKLVADGETMVETVAVAKPTAGSQVHGPIDDTLPIMSSHTVAKLPVWPRAVWCPTEISVILPRKNLCCVFF